MRRMTLLLSTALLGVPSLALAAEDPSTAAQIDEAFGTLVGVVAPILFWEVPGLSMPLIVLLLLVGSVFFTLYHGFLNFRGFKHAIDVTRGKFDNPDDPGEISHFQALTSSLSATVGLGNIAGVAVAVWTGGPGAVMWMILLGLFGMSAKLHECTLAQLYREVDENGVVHGGPMYYLSNGLKERGMGGLGKVLAFIFASFAILGSFGGGNMFQANQSFAALKGQIPMLGTDAASLGFGIFLAVMVGLVIIGGIKSIGRVTEKVIPLMVGIYLVAGIVVIITHIDQVPNAAVLIVTSAFTSHAIFGGFVGVLVQGIKRAVFSNEAGIGSAAIAHAAAKTDEPAREGMVAMLGPFIDTVVICAMTGILLVVSGAAGERAMVTSKAGPFTAAAGQQVQVIIAKSATEDLNYRATFLPSDAEQLSALSADELKGVFAAALPAGAFLGDVATINGGRVQPRVGVTLEAITGPAALKLPKSGDFQLPNSPIDLKEGDTISITASHKVDGKIIKTPMSNTVSAAMAKDQVTPSELATLIFRAAPEGTSTLGDLTRLSVVDGTLIIESNINLGLQIKAAPLGFATERVRGSGTGVEMTRWAFADTMNWFPWILALSVLLFAYSTMISWSYYGERAWNYLFGRSKAAIVTYRLIFLTFVVIGTVSSLEHVIVFSDLMILSMAFPNIIGGVLLAPIVKKKLTTYWASYQNNEFKVYK